MTMKTVKNEGYTVQLVKLNGVEWAKEEGKSRSEVVSCLPFFVCQGLLSKLDKLLQVALTYGVDGLELFLPGEFIKAGHPRLYRGIGEVDGVNEGLLLTQA